MESTPKALLVDIKRCIGCRACVLACQEAHDLPGDETATELSAGALTAMVDQSDERHVRKLCMHCLTPSCVSVCPVGALHKTPAGPVAYQASRCLGCRYCMVACPWSVPRYQWNATVPAVRKCDMCFERLGRGEPTACAEACPAEATVFGTRAAMLEEARDRIRQGGYFAHIYGETEAGGTSVFFLSPVSFAELGFREGLSGQPLPNLTWQVLQKIPGVVTIGGASLAAIWWITHRRMEVAEALSATREGHHES